MTTLKSRAKIGNNLRKLRGEKSLSEVAKSLGITPQAVHNYEMGNRAPTDEIKTKISKYYKTSVQDLFY